jgi:hypothetical protein
MLGVGWGFSYINALFWCHRLSIAKNYFLKWFQEYRSISKKKKKKIVLKNDQKYTL